MRALWFLVRPSVPFLVLLFGIQTIATIKLDYSPQQEEAGNETHEDPPSVNAWYCACAHVLARKFGG